MVWVSEVLRLKTLVLLVNGTGDFNQESDSLWCKVVKAFHGGFCSNIGTGLHKGVWANIQSGNNAIDKVGVHFSTSFYQKVGNGNTLRFWEDVWNTYGLRFETCFPRLYAFEIDKECLV